MSERTLDLGAEGGGEKIRPYEHLSDAELHQLTGDAAALQLRIASTDPRAVVAVMVEHGCPRRDAAGMISDQFLRLGAFRFYFDTIDAALGDREAKQRSEYVAESWRRMRVGQLLDGGRP